MRTGTPYYRDRFSSSGSLAMLAAMRRASWLRRHRIVSWRGHSSNTRMRWRMVCLIRAERIQWMRTQTACTA